MTLDFIWSPNSIRVEWNFIFHARYYSSKSLYTQFGKLFQENVFIDFFFSMISIPLWYSTCQSVIGAKPPETNRDIIA